MANKPQIFDYDLIIIGSGAAGSVAAHIVAQTGKNVAVVENDQIGGECPNHGCIPVGAMLKTAKIYRDIKKADKYGLKANVSNPNLTNISKWLDLAKLRTGVHESHQSFVAQDIALIKGNAHFISPYEITTGTRRYSAKKFLIATGSKPIIPLINGLSETGFMTSRDVINLTKPIKKIFIIGGGAIALELATAFSTFGSKVVIAEQESRLLPKEDAEIGKHIKQILEKQYGCEVITNAKILNTAKTARKKTIELEQNGLLGKISVDEILVACGRTPDLDLGLENAGVKYLKHAIKTNEFMQTSAKNIFAAGDVTGKLLRTHMAIYQGRIAAYNLYSDKHNFYKADYHALPRAVYTDPEIAAVGMTESQVLYRKIKHRIGLAPTGIVGKQHTSHEEQGFVKVITSRKGVIIGASIVAPHASEMIHELALAIHNGLKANDVAKTVHVFPTYSEAIRIACQRVG